jgi:xanthine dehydrogenase accessory factor
VVLPATLLPVDVWEAFLDRSSVRVHLTRVGDQLTAASFDDAEADPGSRVADDEVTTAWHPVPTLVLAGGGPVLQALEQLAPPLGWRVQRASDPDTARSLVVGLGPVDSVVLAMHDVELAGPVLASALEGAAGYLGALGSRAMQQSRETWLTDRGVAGLDRIHTPAGLDIGADAPAEVAVAILAESIRERAKQRLR